MKHFNKPLLVLIILGALAFFYLPSLSQYLQLRYQEEKLNRELAALKTQIQELKREEYLIRNDLDYLEKVIRKELGLARSGETIYKVVTEEAPQESDAAVSIEQSPVDVLNIDQLETA